MKMIRSSSCNGVHTSHTDTQTDTQYQLLHGWGGGWDGVAITGGKQMGHEGLQAGTGLRVVRDQIRDLHGHMRNSDQRQRSTTRADQRPQMEAREHRELVKNIQRTTISSQLGCHA